MAKRNNSVVGKETVCRGATRTSGRLAGMALVCSLWLPAMAHGGASQFAQDHFRWRNDNGTAATATWKAATDAALTNAPYGQNIRLRFSISNRKEDQTHLFFMGDFEYATSTNGPWHSVGPATPGSGLCPFEFSDSSWFTNRSPAGNHLEGPSGYTFYDAGELLDRDDSQNDAKILSFRENRYANTEVCIRCTPKATAGETYYFRLTEADFDIQQHAALTLDVNPPHEPPEIVSPLTGVLHASMDPKYSRKYQLAVTGTEPISYETQNMPPGFGLYVGAHGNSWIEDDGTPSTPGTYDVTITARNAYGSDTKVVALTVEDGQKPMIQSVVLGEVGKPLRYTASASGTAPMEFSATVASGGEDGQLPAGLTFSTVGTTGTLSGTPQRASLTKLLITASNAFSVARSPVIVRVLEGESATDTDGDGIPDAWELDHFGSPTAADAGADPDADGMSNLEEYVARTDPNDGQSVFEIEAMAATPEPTISFQSKPDRRYTVEAKGNLTETNAWETLLDDVTGTGGALEVADGEGMDRRSYRIKVRLP